MSVENTFGIAVRIVLTRQLPDDDSLVYNTRVLDQSERKIREKEPSTSRRCKDHLWVFRRSSDGGDPSFVACQGAEESQRVGHFVRRGKDSWQRLLRNMCYSSASTTSAIFRKRARGCDSHCDIVTTYCTAPEIASAPLVLSVGGGECRCSSGCCQQIGRAHV